MKNKNLFKRTSAEVETDLVAATADFDDVTFKVYGVDAELGERRHDHFVATMVDLLKNTKKKGVIRKKHLDELKKDFERFFNGTKSGPFSSINLTKEDSHIILQYKTRDTLNNKFLNGLVYSALGLSGVVEQFTGKKYSKNSITIEAALDVVKQDKNAVEDVLETVSAISSLLNMDGLRYRPGMEGTLKHFALESPSGSNYTGCVVYYRTEKDEGRIMISINRDSDETKTNKQFSKLNAKIEEVVEFLDNKINFVDIEAAPAESVVQVLEKSGNYKILIEAIKAAGLYQTLNSNDKQFTIIAPNDNAFGKFPKATLAAFLQAKNRPLVEELIKLHVIETKIVAENFEEKEKALSGDLIYINQDNGTTKLSTHDYGDHVLLARTNINAKNGMIHAAANVLVSPAILKKLESLEYVEPVAGAFEPPAFQQKGKNKFVNHKKLINKK